MADYYPLISRAVAALEKNNGENRRALYERARTALLAQLRGVTPALEESDITRERLALEESIRKVEAESARQFVEASRQMSAAKIRQSRQWDEPPKLRPTEARPAEPRRWDEVEPPASAPRRYVSPPSPAPQDSAPASPQERARRAWLPGAAPRSDSIFDRPLPPSPQAPSPQPPSPAARDVGTAAEHHALLDAAPEDARGVAAAEVDGARRAEESERAGGAAAAARELARGRGFFNRLKFGRSAKSVEPQARQERMFEPSPHEPRPHEGFSEPMLESSYPLDDSHPPPDQDRYASTDAIDDEFEVEESLTRSRYERRALVASGLIAAALIFAVGAVLVWQWPNMVALYRSFRAPAVDTARDVPPPATTRPKIGRAHV